MKRNHTLNTAGMSLCAVLALAVVTLTAHITMVLPIGFDEAFNFQVAQSLATHFTYENTYAPPVVYNPSITTNGPIQYIAALVYMMSRNPDTTIVTVTTIAMALLMSAAFMMRPWIAALLAAIYPFWATFVFAGTAFLGDIFATAMLLFGILSFERALIRSNARAVVRDPLFFLGCVCFGIAVSTKLLTAIIVVPLLFGLFAKRETLSSAVLITAYASFLTTLVFFLQFAFSIGHTTGAWFAGRTFSALAAFLQGHFSQASGSAQQNHGIGNLSAFTNHAVLITIVLCAAFLIQARPAFTLLVGTMLTLMLVAGMEERRMLPTALVVLILGAREAVPRIRMLLAHWSPLKQTNAAPAALILAFLLLNAFLGRGFKQKFYGDPNRTLALGAIYKGYHFHPELIDTLRKQPYVLTSGWWQFAEIALRYNLHFYNRMAPENAHIPASRAVLLFNTTLGSLWPKTTIESNCSSIIYREGPLVICKPRTDVSFSYTPSTSVATQSGELATP